MENEDIKEETKEEKKLTAKSIFSGNNLKNLIIFAGILGIALIFLSSFMGKKTEETDTPVCQRLSQISMVQERQIFLLQ